MALYGKNLANAAGPGTTWDQADVVLSILGQGILECYPSLSLWENYHSGAGIADTVNLAILSAISPDDARTAKQQLDDDLAGIYAFRQMVQESGAAAGFDTALPDDFLNILRSKIEISSAQIALNDRLFHTSIASQVSDQIVPAVGGIADTIANAASKAVGNLLGGLWWVIALAAVAIFAWKRAVKA